MDIHVTFMESMVLHTVSVHGLELCRLFSAESTDEPTQVQKKKLHGFQYKRSFFLFVHHNERARCIIHLKKKLNKGTFVK